MRWCGVALVLVAATASAAEDDPCVTQRNTIEMNECARRQMQGAEDGLNTTYRAAIAALDKQGDIKKQLIQAQRHWIKFRDTNCNAVLAKNADGSLRTVLYLGCMKQLAEERTQQLRLWFLPQH